MLLKLVFLSAFLFQMMGSAKTEKDYGCATGQVCPCCERNTYDEDRKCIIACKDGYWGGRCYHKCPSYCIRCGREFGNANYQTYQKCYKCADGFYNGTSITNCTTPCPDTCNDLLCDATNGSCLYGCINKNITGDKCDQCKQGKFGTNCSFSCPPNCKSSVCSRTEGKCTYGCVSNVFEGDKCNTCVVGNYGKYCDKTCPKNCRDNVCFKINGTCTAGCKGNFVGEVCNRCKDGYFGNDCTKPCPSSCLHGICNFTSGFCNECPVRWFGSNCEERCPSDCLDGGCNIKTGLCEGCKRESFGSYCNITCSFGCKDRVCEQDSGVCLNNCNLNFSGDKCCVESNNCMTCSSSTECKVCTIGYYGNNCQNVCPSNCKNGCDIATGNCNSCKNDSYGERCNKSCSPVCKRDIDKNTCDSENGHCIFGCKEGYFSSICNKDCSGKCFGNRCTQDNGKCGRCYQGYYGDYCDRKCGKCKNDTCHQASSQCLYGCVGGYNGYNCINEMEKESGGNVIAEVVGSVSAVIVIAAVVTIVIWYIRKRKQGIKYTKDIENVEHSFSQASGCQEQGPVYENALAVKASQRRRKQTTEGDNIEISLELQEDDQQFDTDLPGNEDGYYNTSGASENIRISDLFEHVSSKGPNYFKQEFQEIPTSFEYPCSVAMKAENIEKNRYNGIYPYDHSRVKISGQSNFFINACYIDGYRKEKAYIASLGPTRSTTEDFVTFWEMVWYEKADIIVMLTNLEEATGMKCGQYWPQLEITQSYGDVAVKCRSEETFAEYTLRTFTLSKKKNRRTLTQLHYTAWPDKGVPDSVTSLIEFRQRVKTFPNMTGGPTIVHCSAGVGRTGTYIAFDRLTEEGQSEDFISVVNCITSMRQQRLNMVQTKEQYLYVYRALVYSLTFGCDAIPADTFQEYVESTSKALFVSKFTQLSRQIEEESAEETEAMNMNQQYIDKNRVEADIPGNRNRPRLYLNRVSNESDYINAVYMNSFKKKNYFILSQTPLPTTVQDFLCLIYQENVSCIVAMDDIRAKGTDVGTYIAADSQPVRHGNFTVTTTKCASTHKYIVRKLVIQNSGQQRTGTKTIYLFQYAGWNAGDSIPSDAEDFVQFVEAVETKESELQEEEPRILIHCLDGAERSGLFCAIFILLEKIDVEGQVSVVNTLRQVRARRRAAIPNVEQFEFCHRCISTHLDMFSTYTNFAMTSK